MNCLFGLVFGVNNQFEPETVELYQANILLL